jgi:hypothetical protein
MVCWHAVLLATRPQLRICSGRGTVYTGTALWFSGQAATMQGQHVRGGKKKRFAERLLHLFSNKV